MSFIVYDYHCDECDVTRADRFVRRAERDTECCPSCGHYMRRLMPGPTTTFKMHDRSAIKSKKAVSLRGPNHGAPAKGHSASLD